MVTKAMQALQRQIPVKKNGVARRRPAGSAPAGCDFHDFWSSTKSEIAREGARPIASSYVFERDKRVSRRHPLFAARQKLSRPKVRGLLCIGPTAAFAHSRGKTIWQKPSAMGLARQEGLQPVLSDGACSHRQQPLRANKRETNRGG